MQNKIRKLRLKHGWNVAELALKARVTRPTIYSLEAGHPPTLQVAFQIAGVFGLRIEDVFSPDKTAGRRASPKPQETRHQIRRPRHAWPLTTSPVL